MAILSLCSCIKYIERETWGGGGGGGGWLGVGRNDCFQINLSVACDLLWWCVVMFMARSSGNNNNQQR